MASLTITIVVSADPTENVHTKVVASGAEVWEIQPMLEKAIADLQAELAALPPSHSPWCEDETTALAAIEAHREWDARRKVLEEAAAMADAYRCGVCGMDGKAGTAIRDLIGPEPTDG